MHQKDMLKLWANKELGEYIRGQARRHFTNEQDREDACSEAWERIAGCSTRANMETIKNAGMNAIHAFYERERRRRIRERIIQKVNITVQ